MRLSKKKGKSGVWLMKNYYEILEVNPKASKEVIEKAYKVLVGKYHPDLYSGEKQQYAEKRTKEINEAYHVLSDDFLREQYGRELEKQNIDTRQSIPRQNKINHNQMKQEQRDTLQKTTKAPQVGSFGAIIQIVKELIQDLAKSKQKRGKRKEMTKQDIFAILLTILVIIIIGVVLWFIPFTNGWMREFLFENPLFNWIGNLFETVQRH